MKTGYYWLLSLCALAILVNVPVFQYRVISSGVDAYLAHKPLFGENVQSQIITTSAKTTAIGTILVDLRKTNNLTDVQVDILNADNNEPLTSARIFKESIKDDTFAYANFSKSPIEKGKKIIIQFSAPDATNTNPTGIRLDPQTKHLSLALKERVPVWKAIQTIADNRAEAWQYILPAIILALIIAIPIYIPSKKLAWLITLAIICVAALAARFWVIPQFSGVSGGDAYNYLSITRSIINFDNPFTNTKRLPGHPLLFVPTLASGIFDDQQVMRTVSIIASIVTIIMTVALAKILKLSWPVAISAAAILAFQKDFFWTSMRPEPYTFYTALLISTLVLFFVAYKKTAVWWKYILFGLLLGYAAITRQEGFMLAVVLGVCSLVYELALSFRPCCAPRSLGEVGSRNPRRSIVRFMCMYLPVLFIVLPFFIHNTLTYGNPLYTQYLEGDRLQIVNSFFAFQDATGATWGILGSMWKPSWEQLERLDITNNIFLIGFFSLIIWYTILRIKKIAAYQTVFGVIMTITFCTIIWAAIYVPSVFTNIFTITSAALILASIPLFLIEKKWRALVILLVLISQLGIATWFHPFAKHYQQSYPLIVLMISVALFSRIPKQKFASSAIVAALVLPFLVISSFLGQKINAAIDEQNQETALDSVIYRAARAARGSESPIGFDQAYLPARLYFDEVAKYFPAEENPTPEQEQQWLTENNIKTLVVTNADNIFKTPHPSWKTLVSFKAEGEDENLLVGTVYTIPR